MQQRALALQQEDLASLSARLAAASDQEAIKAEVQQHGEQWCREAGGGGATQLAQDNLATLVGGVSVMLVSLR